MTVCIETLELTPEQREASKEAIRRLAFAKWVEAGRPEGADRECWLAAEREWIARCYVPDRGLRGGNGEQRC